MALLQASLGLLFLGQLLLSSSSVASDTCEVIIPVNTTVKLGQKAVLQCRLTSQNIAWTFCSRGAGPYQIAVNCDLVPSTVDSYRLDKSTTNACHLVIDNVTVSHLGKYTCQDLNLDDHGHTVELGNSNENLALNKPTVQSSTYSALTPSNKAVDGIIPEVLGDCAITNIVAPAWWAVDLGQETPIGRVRITNRKEGYPEQTSDFFIGLTNVSPWTTPPSVVASSTTICKYYTGHPSLGIPTDIFCNPNTGAGRYLFVYMTQAQFLSICELEAFYN